MNDLMAMLFVDPMDLTRFQQALMLLPLCLAVSVVYKTTKCETLREIPKAAVVNWVLIVAGMYAVGGVLWVLHRLIT